ncbi:unnamed protein product [Parajaminaea phylloscopi]
MAALVDKLSNAIKDATPAIKAGANVPSGYAVKEDNPEQANVDLGKLTGKNILVGVPGPFTPPCSSQVPGYIQNAENFTQKGVKGIYVVTVNDLFVVQAWKEKLGAKGDAVHFVADDTGAFTNAVGLSFDASGLLGNARSKRYVALLSNNTVEKIWVEENAPDVKATSADAVLQQL